MWAVSFINIILKITTHLRNDQYCIVKIVKRKKKKTKKKKPQTIIISRIIHTRAEING